MDKSNFLVKKGYDLSWLDQALALYNRTEMKRSNRDQVHEAFLQSQSVVSIWQGSTLVAVGRAITDFKMYSAIFDVAVDPDFQKLGVGRMIMMSLIEPLKGTCVYLTSTFGNENFYKKQGFRFHKSALALYPEKMQYTPYLFRSYQVSPDLSRFKDFQVTPGKFTDSVECFALNLQLGYETNEADFTKRFLFLISHPEHAVIVAKNLNGEIVAWMHMGLRFLLEDENFAQLAAVIVREQERGSGLGTHLLKVAEDWSRYNGMKKIALNSSLPRERAHSFYLKNGYAHSKTSKSFVKDLSC